MRQDHRLTPTGIAGSGLTAQRLVERHQHVKVSRPAHRPRGRGDSHTSDHRDQEHLGIVWQREISGSGNKRGAGASSSGAALLSPALPVQVLTGSEAGVEVRRRPK